MLPTSNGQNALTTITIGVGRSNRHLRCSRCHGSVRKRVFSQVACSGFTETHARNTVKRYHAKNNQKITSNFTFQQAKEESEAQIIGDYEKN